MDEEIKNEEKKAPNIFKPENITASYMQTVPDQECPNCLEIHDEGLMECVECNQTNGSEQCQKPPNPNQPELYNCMKCMKNGVRMRKPNKWILKLFHEVLLYDCNDCQKSWTLNDYKTHKQQGKCN